MAELPQIKGPFAATLVEKGLQELINTKHLYQSLKIDFTPAVLRTAIEMRGRALMDGRVQNVDELTTLLCAEMAAREFLFSSPAVPNFHCIVLSMPPVRTLCGTCNDVEAFNLRDGLSSIHSSNGKTTNEQVFWFELECQRCKENVIVLVVKKTGAKLQIVGRSEFEEVKIPDHIPKAQKQFYSEAVIAFQCNSVLSGIFMLRTVVEQHMRTVTDSKELRGEALAAEYAKTLPTNFSSLFPSLSAVYGELSVALHNADANTEVFESQLGKIDAHFEGLAVIRRSAQKK